MDHLISAIGGSGATIAWLSLAFGVLIVFLGLISLMRGPDPVSQRLLQAHRVPTSDGIAPLVRPKAHTPTGLMKALVPSKENEFSSVRQQLWLAGFVGRSAVANYFLIRSLLGLLLPGILAALALAQLYLTLPEYVSDVLPDLRRQGVLFLILVLIVGGFYGPSFYIRHKISERRLKVTEGFPNTLDLMQISVEAGLGFDAAMARVASEIRRSSPVIAEEFEFAQREISAGRERNAALSDMANRMGVPEVSSFVSVVLQSMQFGTSISEALTAYAQDMRLQRELKAQEKANKLPVQMSGVLVVFMLPAILATALTPLVIRFIRILAPVAAQLT